jgi:hypothetical protein
MSKRPEYPGPSIPFVSTSYQEKEEGKVGNLRQWKTEEYTYTYTAEDHARTAHWTDEQAMQWLWDTAKWIWDMRTDEENAAAMRRKGKYGDYVEYMIQIRVYNNPEAWRYLPDDDKAHYMAEHGIIES